jgi:hypothetical protein
MVYVYVLVRQDLPPVQIAVQAAHAAVEAARQFLLPDSDHPHLVLCAVASEVRLLAAADHLFRRGVRHALFREPDRGGEATALATEPLAGERRRVLDRFHCLRPEAVRAAPAPGPEANPPGGCRPEPVPCPL